MHEEQQQEHAFPSAIQRFGVAGMTRHLLTCGDENGCQDTHALCPHLLDADNRLRSDVMPDPPSVTMTVLWLCCDCAMTVTVTVL